MTPHHLSLIQPHQLGPFGPRSYIAWCLPKSASNDAQAAVEKHCQRQLPLQHGPGRCWSQQQARQIWSSFAINDQKPVAAGDRAGRCQNTVRSPTSLPAAPTWLGTNFFLTSAYLGIA